MVKERPVRVYKNRKGQHYVKIGKKKKVLLKNYNSNRIHLVNTIINNTVAKKKTKKKPLLRKKTEAFNLSLPQFLVQKFNGYNELERLNREINEAKRIASIPTAKKEEIKPKTEPISELETDEFTLPEKDISFAPIPPLEPATPKILPKPTSRAEERLARSLRKEIIDSKNYLTPKPNRKIVFTPQSLDSDVTPPSVALSTTTPEDQRLAVRKPEIEREVKIAEPTEWTPGKEPFQRALDQDYPTLVQQLEYTDKVGNEQPIYVRYTVPGGAEEIKAYSNKKSFFSSIGYLSKADRLELFKMLGTRSLIRVNKPSIISALQKIGDGNNFVLANASRFQLETRAKKGRKSIGTPRFRIGSGEKSKIQKNRELYDTELISALSPYRDFVGVVMVDEVKGLLQRMIDEDRRKFGFVMNTAPSSQDGEHWVGIYVDLDDDKQICYFNSFADPIPDGVKKDLKWYVKEAGVPWKLKLKENGTVQQSDKSNRCGYHTARFLIDMFKHGDFDLATEYSVRSGEGDAKEREKTWREFGYM